MSDKRREYGTVREIKYDIDLIWSNCEIFNGKADVDDPQLYGFSNFAADLQLTLNGYLDELEQNLMEKGYIFATEKDRFEYQMQKVATSLSAKWTPQSHDQ